MLPERHRTDGLAALCAEVLRTSSQCALARAAVTGTLQPAAILMAVTPEHLPPVTGTGPYLGLDFFTEAEAGVFFGRNGDRRMIVANLRASRLTVLDEQAASARARCSGPGVAARLRELAVRSFAERGSARHIPVVFASWRDEPIDGLIAAVERSISPFTPLGAGETLAGSDLADALATAADATNATLLIILDQFEEYLLYASRDRARDDLRRVWLPASASPASARTS